MTQKTNNIISNNVVRSKTGSYYWDIVMRFSTKVITLSLFFMTVSSIGYTQVADDEINPQALIFMEKAADFTNKGQLDDAIGYYETALALHPRNRKAYIALAEIAEKQKLNGKAITLYKEVLEINPNDQIALIQQGRLFASKGALERAKTNLARLKILCGVNCSDNESLKIAINDAANKGEILASDITVKPESESQN